MWGYHDGFGWWMGFGAISMVLFWGLVIWAIVGLTRRPQHRASLSEDPLAIAKRRLAYGEISEAEYDRLVAKLKA